MEADKERRAVMPTVDGIRGHMVTTPGEDELRLRLTLAASAEPITPAEADQLLASLRDRPRLPDVCMLPACGCSGEAHP